MGRFFLHCLFLGALLSLNLASCTITDDEEPRRTYPSRRAIDGRRGRKFYDPEEDGPFDTYGSSGGQYDPYEEETDLSDIRNNVPGEPGVDYPSYTRLPQTGFVCEGHFNGYYADESAGCQVFHVCDGNFLISSFLCPIGSIFSQKFLTCDWWSKVDCSSTRNYHVINSQSAGSEIESDDDTDDDISRKVFATKNIQSVDERIQGETVSHQQPRNQDRRHRILNNAVSGSSITKQINDLPNSQDNYSDYPDYPSRLFSRYKSTSGQQKRQRNQETDYDSVNLETEVQRRNENPSRRIHTIIEDRKNYHQDSLTNEFQSSHVSTVPTVTTTAKRYYSPTISTTYRPSTASETSVNYDLDFESSDHLYKARGRSEEIIKAATPPSFLKKDAPIVDNLNLSSFVNGTDEEIKKIDNMEKSESSDNRYNLSNDKIHENSTKIVTLNDTIISLDDKEQVIDRDLDHLMKKITETLSIMTIDNENRDPAGFSYRHDEETSTTEHIVKKSENSTKKNENIVKSFAEPPTILNTTSFDHEDDLKKDEKPAEFLQPPKESMSEFRIMVLDKSKGNEKFVNSEKLIKKNCTEKNVEKLEEKIHEVEGKLLNVEVTSPQLNDEKESRESRIYRFFINNSTGTNSTEVPKVLETSTEKIKSIDLTPPAVFNGNFSGSKINPAKVVEKLEVVKSFDESSLNSTTLAEFISTTTPFTPQNLTSKNITLRLENPIDLIGEKVFSMESNVTKVDNKVDEKFISKDSNVTKLDIESLNNLATFPREKDNFKRFNQTEKIVFNDSNVDDSVQLGSSPFQVTLTVNKHDEIDPHGEVIRKLIAQQEIGDSVGAENYKSFEIIKSTEPQESDKNPEINLGRDSMILRNDRRLNDDDGIVDENLHSTNYLRSIVALVNGPNLPRPFSFESPNNVEMKNSSDLSEELISTSSKFPQTNKDIKNSETTKSSIQTARSVSSTPQPESEKSSETLEVSSSGFPREINNNRGFLGELSQTFGDRERKISKEKLIFDLPDPSRMVNFESDPRLPEVINPRINEQHKIEKLKKKEQEMKKLHEETIVQTEFIPSIGFSLNTDEERNEYMEAVMKGLLPDVRPTETPNTETKTSNDS